MTSSGKKLSPRPICPHSHRPVHNHADLPPTADQDRCPVCWEDWYGINGEGSITMPVIISQCGHVFCHTCFNKQRDDTLECAIPWCRRDNGLAPLNLQSCSDCISWDDNFEQPDQNKWVLTVRKDMIEDILAELKELAEDDEEFFKIPKKKLQQLTREWKEVLHMYEGQYHRPQDLAEILDPFRGADVFFEEVAFRYGNELLQPMPDEYDYPGASAAVLDDFPGGVDEPWISTAIRAVMERLGNEDGEWQRYHEQGERMLRHDQDRESHMDEDGAWVDIWPVKKILAHRVNDDGQVEYQIQFMGCTGPQETVWKVREEIGNENIWMKYNAENAVQVDDEEEENISDDLSDAEMEDVE